jgi:hypothetical protein
VTTVAVGITLEVLAVSWLHTGVPCRRELVLTGVLPTAELPGAVGIARFSCSTKLLSLVAMLNVASLLGVALAAWRVVLRRDVLSTSLSMKSRKRLTYPGYVNMG